MCKKTISAAAFVALSISGCVNQNSLTQDQIEKQNRTDAVVSNVLFEHGLDEAASYNVHKDGFLVVKFAESVSSRKYTEVVGILRSSPEINGVRAEQGGREVCKLTGFR